MVEASIVGLLLNVNGCVMSRNPGHELYLLHPNSFSSRVTTLVGVKRIKVAHTIKRNMQCVLLNKHTSNAFFP